MISEWARLAAVLGMFHCLKYSTVVAHSGFSFSCTAAAAAARGADRHCQRVLQARPRAVSNEPELRGVGSLSRCAPVRGAAPWCLSAVFASRPFGRGLEAL